MGGGSFLHSISARPMTTILDTIPDIHFSRRSTGHNPRHPLFEARGVLALEGLMRPAWGAGRKTGNRGPPLKRRSGG
jgi:hypothetical protein